jgi:hypothetical protein
MDLDSPKQLVTKAGYAAVGAPIVIGRRIKDLGAKLADHTQAQYEAFANEGAKMTQQLQKRNVVEEIEQRIHLDKVQDRVEKLRDQLEGALHSWRESFAPMAPSAPDGATTKAPTAAPKAEKPAAKKAPTRKPGAKAAAKKAPAKGSPAGKPDTK